VKSNAYGHGLVDFSKEIASLGIDWFAVDSVVEGLRLRKEGIDKPILVLGYTLPERIQEAIEHNISITLSNMYAAQGMKDLNLSGRVKVHIKIDSGMHRQGFMEYDLVPVLHFLKEHQDLVEVEGLYTHFAATRGPEDKEHTYKQVDVFKKWMTAFEEAGFKPIAHAARTGSSLLFPDTTFDMVRVGMGFHGIWPTRGIAESMKGKVELKPTLSWKSIISEIKTIPAGDKVGYDFTEEVTRETKIAVCPIGYWHGIPWSLSSKGFVLVNGVKVKIIGRVSMDMIVIDVTDVPTSNIGDEVVLIGKSGDLYLGAEELAALAHTSTYEYITRINPLIKKIYI
jgi:alanine racemase